MVFDFIGSDWQFVSYDSLPSEIDIRMAVEKLLTIEFIKENMSVLKEHQMQSIRGPIPSLVLPEYVIGMNP